MPKHQSPTTVEHSAPSTSFTQYLARVSALHPWRVLTVWGLILAASVVAIGALHRVGVHLRRQPHHQPRLGAGRAGDRRQLLPG